MTDDDIFNNGDPEVMRELDKVVSMDEYRRRKHEASEHLLKRSHPSLYHAPEWMVSFLRPDQAQPEKWMRPVIVYVKGYTAVSAETQARHHFVETYGDVPEGTLIHTRRMEDGQ